MAGDQTRKETVLVGMTGRKDSSVAAYLLKKQGYHVIGIGISFQTAESDEDLEDVATEEEEKEESVIEIPESEFGVHLIQDLQKVKDICDRLEIDFYAVNARDIYRARLLEFMIGARLQGTSFSPIIYCNNIIMDILLAKAKKLGATKIATGHYCKIHKNQVTEEYTVMMANDAQYDQSFELCRLREKHLKKLVLPLADIRKEEVNKIMGLLGLDLEDGDLIEKNRPMEDPRLTMLVKDQAPETLRKEGSLMNLKEDLVVCDHSGIHQFYLGQEKITLDKNIAIDKGLGVVNIIPGNGSVYISPLSECQFKYMSVKKFLSELTFDNSKPLESYVKWEAKGEKHPCTVYFKNNKIISVELHETFQGILPPGIIVVFYNRSGIGGRVIGSGVLMKAGRLEDDKIIHLPEKIDEFAEEEVKDEDVIKMDPNGHKF